MNNDNKSVRNKRTKTGETPDAKPQKLFDSDEPASKPIESESPVSATSPAKPEGVKLDEPENGPDPNDLGSLWAPTPIVATRENVMNIQVGTKPPKDKWIRVMDFETEGYTNCRPVYLFEYQFDGELTPKSYYVRPETEVAELLASHDRLTNALLVFGVVRLGGHFVWELKIPDGRNDSADKWSSSRMQIAKLATEKWLKPKANMAGGGYDYVEPTAQYEDPTWKLTFDRAIELATKGRIIADLKHDAVKDAMGL